MNNHLSKTSGLQALKALTENTSPARKRQAVRGMFNAIAPTYDLLNHLLSMSIDKLWRSDALAQMHINSKSVILDLACGTGDLSLAALKRRPASVISVDPARQMLSRTVQKTKKYSYKVRILESFGEELPLRSHVCTHAMIGFGIRNVSDRPAVFREIARLLRSPGIFMILEFSHWEKGLIGSLFKLYFHKILPMAGSLVSKDKSAYTYLPASVERFVSSEKLIEEVELNGFTLLHSKRYFWGVATCYVFRKKANIR